VHWGTVGDLNGEERKNLGGGHVISALTAPAAFAFASSPVTSSWTDGSPDMTLGTKSGFLVHQSNFFAFTVPARTTAQVLRLYVGVQDADATLGVALTDSSAVPQTRSLSNGGGTTNVQYAITFAAATDTADVSVSWTDTNDANQGNSFAVLFAATLANQ
jgi:hypothetical protein